LEIKKNQPKEIKERETLLHTRKTGASISPMELWAWGANNYGQLGLGFVSEQCETPVQVGTANMVP
jgi:alpha-tubulin suppressor-like RCC1 family protein